MIQPPKTAGGKRANAGRKPDEFKRLFDTAAKNQVTQAEMDELVKSLLASAKSGDIKATAYLLDRLLGKPVQAIATEEGGFKIIIAYENRPADSTDPA
jgi:hypothetical protein